MDAGRASLTALGTALMRAVHSRVDRPALLDDRWGDRLVLDAERDLLRAATGAADVDAALRAHPSYGTVILRSRYAEDALRDAVVRGARQYVIVGAGMDSFALRRPDFARGVDVFEVDHPATQEFKVRRLADRGIALPAGLHFVAADLSEVALDVALRASPYRSDVPTFFSWLGVTPYLSREANLATLRAIASCACNGSHLVFSYTDQRVFDGDSAALQGVRTALAAAGEPWISGFHPAQLAEDLRTTGLRLIEDLGPEQLHNRYCANRTDGLTPSLHAHVAQARVPM